MDSGTRFIETVTPLIWQWGNDEIASGLIKLLFLSIFVIKIYPWLLDIWDKITEHGTT